MKMVNLNHQQTKGGKKHEETDCGIRTLRGDGGGSGDRLLSHGFEGDRKGTCG